MMQLVLLRQGSAVYFVKLLFFLFLIIGFIPCQITCNFFKYILIFRWGLTLR